MDKKLILAVAGSGKTTYLINQLNKENKFLIITYTINNYNNIRNRIIEKFGVIPSNIEIYRYFQFIYNICFRPLAGNFETNGINFISEAPRYINQNNMKHYINDKGYVYASRISKLCLNYFIEDIKIRLEKYYDYILIDEVQDYSGYDYDFLLKITELNINLVYVGDFFQHTYESSMDGSKNKNLYNNYKNYIKNFKNMSVEENILEKSYRCDEKICGFIRENLGINIYSRKTSSKIIIKECIDEKEIDDIINNNKIKKLYYQKSYNYYGENINWGDSKGSTYNDICVILNPQTYKLYKNQELNKLPGKTKNKFYVACTRTKNNLYFIEEKKIKKYLK